MGQCSDSRCVIGFNQGPPVSQEHCHASQVDYIRVQVLGEKNVPDTKDIFEVKLPSE